VCVCGVWLYRSFAGSYRLVRGSVRRVWNADCARRHRVSAGEARRALGGSSNPALPTTAAAAAAAATEDERTSRKHRRLTLKLHYFDQSWIRWTTSRKLTTGCITSWHVKMLQICRRSSMFCVACSTTRCGFDLLYTIDSMWTCRTACCTACCTRNPSQVEVSGVWA